MQAHLKPYQLHYRYSENELYSCDMQTVKSDPKQVNHKQARPKRNISPPVKLVNRLHTCRLGSQPKSTENVFISSQKCSKTYNFFKVLNMLAGWMFHVRMY